MSEKWYRRIGENGDMVVSTRIRLARNLAHYPFPAQMTAKQAADVVKRVREATEQISGLTLRYIELADLPERDVLAMVERHVISYDLARAHRGSLLLSEDEQISIMINEEDHVRIQVMVPGLDPESAYALADRVDTALDERLHFAFDDRLGYLTQCPSNLGTGMRASLMMHLPALQERGVIQQLTGTVSKLGLTIRGAFGEGSQPQGAMYQMSNQVTLGISEQAAIENLRGIASQILKQEKDLRKEFLNKITFEDRIWRSLGVLKTARMLSHEEALKLLSNVRLGVAEGMLDSVSLETVTALMNDVHPGCIMADAGEDMTAEVRDSRRASMVRTAL
ncbi:MAG: protein arginine kinase [Clostridia bacterium]|nr:protein arginine kinase [Clostridia bacterium]